MGTIAACVVLVPGLNLLHGCCSGRAAPSWAAEAGPSPHLANTDHAATARSRNTSSGFNITACWKKVNERIPATKYQNWVQKCQLSLTFYIVVGQHGSAYSTRLP